MKMPNWINLDIIVFSHIIHPLQQMAHEGLVKKYFDLMDIAKHWLVSQHNSVIAKLFSKNDFLLQ